MSAVLLGIARLATSHNFRALIGRLPELKKGLFSEPKLSHLRHTGPKLELKTGPFKAHVNAPFDQDIGKFYARLAILVNPQKLSGSEIKRGKYVIPSH